MRKVLMAAVAAAALAGPAAGQDDAARTRYAHTVFVAHRAAVCLDLSDQRVSQIATLLVWADFRAFGNNPSQEQKAWSEGVMMGVVASIADAMDRDHVAFCRPAADAFREQMMAR